jgi:hypothetical protein
MGKLELKDLDDNIRGGFSVAERDRLADAFWNLRFSQAQFLEWEARESGGDTTRTAADTWDHMSTSGSGSGERPDYDVPSTHRSTPLFRRVMHVMTANLYKAPLGRRLATPESTDWLNRVYQANAMSAKWQRADQLTFVGGFSAFQFAGHDDEQRPLRIHLWGPEQCVVYCDPDDQTEAAAVAVIDLYDGQRRLTLWTEETVAYYATKKGGPYPADGSTAWTFQRKKDNPYRMPKSAADQGRGILPFAFAHFNFPVQEFDTTGPGNNLRELNDAVNFGLNDLGDGIRYLAKPIGLAEGVDESWSPPAKILPGMFLNLPASSVNAAGDGPVPTLRFVSPDLGFVDVVWNDLNKFIDHSLEMHGVPPSTIRMSLNAQSGVAILAEQSPLLTWAESRRRPFAHYEERAALVALQVGAAHLRNNNRDAGELEEVLGDPRLALTWPRMYVQLPGPEQRLEDDYRIQRGYSSKLSLLMEREDLTEDQAFERLEQVRKQNERLAAAGIDPTAAPVAGPGSFGQPIDAGGGFGGPAAGGGALTTEEDGPPTIQPPQTAEA